VPSNHGCDLTTLGASPEPVAGGPGSLGEDPVHSSDCVRRHKWLAKTYVDQSIPLGVMLM